MLKIPFGETLSYEEPAEFHEHQRAVRAVGSANSRNRASPS